MYPIHHSFLGRAVSGFDGHVILSITNSPNNPESPDRTVGDQYQCNKHCLTSALSIRSFMHSNQNYQQKHGEFIGANLAVARS